MKRNVYFAVVIVLVGLGFVHGYALRSILNALVEADVRQYMAQVENQSVTLVKDFIDLAAGKGRWLDAINQYMHPVVREVFAQTYVENGGRQTTVPNQVVSINSLKFVGIDPETAVITVRADYTVYRALGSYREPLHRSVSNFLLQYTSDEKPVIIGIQDLCNLNPELCRI